jgi:serpin B
MHWDPCRRPLMSALCGSVALAAAACSGGGDGSPGTTVVQSSLARNDAPVVDPADAAELVKDNTTFAFDLYAGVAKGDETSNLFFSPYSVSIALAMTYAGAADPTAKEMATALDFTLPPEKLHPAFDSLDLALASRAKGQAGATGKPFQLRVVDSLWADASIPFETPFLDTLAVNYGAGMRQVDFVGAAESARAKINSWVSGETENRIQNLLPSGSVDASTRLVLVNAIYFNAGWATKFDPNSTFPGTFHKLDGGTVATSTMSQAGSMGYAEGANYQAVELTYAGNQTSMVFILPRDGAFSDVEHALTGDFVGSVFTSLQNTSVSLSVPKFIVQGATISLKAQLSALGMADAFTGAANFSGMTTADHLEIGDVLHQAFVKVDEDGTEAAAATAVTVRDAAAIQSNEIVSIDRPFFYVIRDIPTNTVLFAGREMNPS